MDNFSCYLHVFLFQPNIKIQIIFKYLHIKDPYTLIDILKSKLLKTLIDPF